MVIKLGEYYLTIMRSDKYQKIRRERKVMADVSVAAANSLLELSFADDKYISPLKLQKLLYFVHKEYLKRTNGEALITERFDAWDYGPVLPTVYRAFKTFGSSSITKLMAEDGEVYVISEKNRDFEAALEDVWKRYSDLTAQTLVDMTHMSGGAWEKARRDKVSLSNDDIFREDDWD